MRVQNKVKKPTGKLTATPVSSSGDGAGSSSDSVSSSLSEDELRSLIGLSSKIGTFNRDNSNNSVSTSPPLVTPNSSSSGSLNPPMHALKESKRKMVGSKKSNSSAQNLKSQTPEQDVNLQFLLVGHANLHRAANNAAQMSMHIHRQFKTFKLNDNGQIVKSNKVKKNPKRDNKPATIEEWNDQYKHKPPQKPPTVSSRRRTGRGQFYLRDEFHAESDSGANPETDSSSDSSLASSDDSISTNSEELARYEKSLQDLLTNVRAATNADEPLDDHNLSNSAYRNGEQDLNQDLNPHTSKPSGYLYGLLEPSIIHDKVVNMGGAEAIFDKNVPNDQVRAALIFNSQLHIWEVPDFCNRDMATGLLTGTKLGDIYVVALYCHQDLPAVPRKFRQLAALAKTENRELLVLSDLNAHSQAFWGGKDTNTRGRKWEEFLERQGQLSVLNKGDKFTFVTGKGQSIIDVTLATPKVACATTYWEVADYVPASDHLAISMVIHTGGGWTIQDKGWDLKSLKEQDWENFFNKMEESSQIFEKGDTWDEAILDEEANFVMCQITSTLDEVAKPLTTRLNIRPLLWWDKECSRLSSRMKAMRQYVRARLHAQTKRGIPFTPFDKPRYTYKDYIAARKAF